jgi:hypothetical protein
VNIRRLAVTALSVAALAGGTLTVAAGSASAGTYPQPQQPSYTQPVYPGFTAPTAFPRLSCTYRDRQLIRILSRYRYLTPQQRAQLRFLEFICGYSYPGFPGYYPGVSGPVNGGAGFPTLY